MNKILVIGSVSVDYTMYTKKLPSKGTTSFGESFSSAVGGKGLNQALAIHLLDGDVSFLGAISDDENADKIKKLIADNHLDAHLLIKKEQTGVASITVEIPSGENRILIIPGANLAINTQDIDNNIDLFNNVKFLVMQLETPIDVVEYVLKIAKEKGITTILNPAPYHALPDSIYPYIDYFIPNEHELEGFTNASKMLIRDKASLLLEKGCKNVLVTLGENGSILVNKNEFIKADAIKVTAIDTVGAGDSYIGAFVTALANGKNLKECMEFATKCSAITVTRKGASSSLPKLSEVK